MQNDTEYNNITRRLLLDGHQRMINEELLLLDDDYDGQIKIQGSIEPSMLKSNLERNLKEQLLFNNFVG